MNAEIQNMIGVLIHVAKSDEFLDHEKKKVLKYIIYRHSIDSDDLVKIISTQENLSEKLLKVKTPDSFVPFSLSRKGCPNTTSP